MKKVILFTNAFFCIFFNPLFSGVSLAAQTAKVVVDSASVFDQPQITGFVVGTVPKDTTIAVSNAPTNGFFKSRIPGGVVGWISGNDIVTGAAATAPSTDATPAPTPEAAVAPEPTPIKPVKASQKPVAQKKIEKKKNPDDVTDHTRIMISGGMQILNNGGIPAAIPITGSKTSYGGTAEVQFKLSDQFHWAGRLEYYKGSSAQVVSASTSQTLAYHSLPILAGIIWDPISKKDFRVGVGAYVGVALMTSLTVVQTSALVSHTVTYSSSDLTEYVNLQGSYAVSSAFSILADVGYRLQSSSYPASTALSVAAFSANYGGIVARLGAEFRL